MVSKPGTFKRGFRLGKLGLSLTGSYLGYQAQKLFLDQDAREQRDHQFQQKASRRVREELGSLKGAVMKLGQLLSLQTHALPPDALEELAKLQMSAPGMHPTLARARFKAALGKYPEEVFKQFDAEPFAAASLGQVHRAITRENEKVAVKIQYPGIRSAIESDFKLLRSAILPGRLTGHTPVAIIDEIQRGFLEETDYLHEGQNSELFARELKSVDFLSVPKVHWNLTTDTVLTMSFIEGYSVVDFLKQRPSQAVRDLVGTRLVSLYFMQLHKLRALHADAHPGNYLFQPDGRIGLVDFGCVKKITFDITALIRCVQARSWRQGEKQARHVLSLIFGPKTPYARARRMLPLLEDMSGALYPKGGGAADFGEVKVLETLGQALTKSLRDRITNPEFAFVSRTDLGLYSLLHQLRARVHVLAAWRQVSGDS